MNRPPDITYPFTEQELETAAVEWGANCGPSALAFALQIGIHQIKGNIPGFEEKGYTSPTMMKQSLESMGIKWHAALFKGADGMFSWPDISLCRIQFTGPWTAPGANPKWAYRQTHWIACYAVDLQAAMVFDCNGGLMSYGKWREEIVPLLTSQIKRADGGWYPTHIWRISR